jgi:hypothetical protein
MTRSQSLVGMLPKRLSVVAVEQTEEATEQHVTQSDWL